MGIKYRRIEVITKEISESCSDRMSSISNADPEPYGESRRSTAALPSHPLRRPRSWRKGKRTPLIVAAHEY